MIPHMGSISLNRVGDADARHLRREIPRVACDQDSPADLRRGQDDCVGRLQSGPFTAKRSGAEGGFLVDLVHAESTEEAQRLRQNRAAFTTPFSAIHVIQTGEIPVVKSRPVRSILILAAMLAAVIFGILGLLLAENYRGVDWGVDAPGRGVFVRYSTRF